MTMLDRDELLKRVRRRAALDEDGSDSRFVELAVEALGSLLTGVPAKAVRRELPACWRPALSRGQRHAPLSLSDLPERVAEVTGQPPSRALEGIGAALAELGDALGPEAHAHIERAVPREWLDAMGTHDARPLTQRLHDPKGQTGSIARGTFPEESRHVATARPSVRGTLADGRTGPSAPLSTTRRPAERPKTTGQTRS